MKTVKISELKASLSAHLARVQHGEEVLVCDRNRPIARIVPIPSQDQSAHEQRLIASGLLIPPLKKRPASWPKPPGNVSQEDMERVWREEREDR